MSPILSIVIPTKNRYDYLKYLVNVLVQNCNSNFEIVIHDNSDDNNLFLLYINKINDNRIKYKHVNHWVSVVENCNLAVEMATGEYVCMIGDDDGILIDNSLKVVNYLKENSIDAALVNPLVYTWPDSGHAVWKDSFSGKVLLQNYSYSYSYLSISEQLNEVVRKGASFGLGKLPRVYHGFVSKEVLDKLWNDVGTYFPGPSPDMANAVGVCKFINRYVYADFPTVISGCSGKSTAGQGGLKKHHGSIDEQTHLPKDTGKNWNVLIPKFWSGPTIYSESAYQTLTKTNQSIIQKFNYNYLYACCLVYEHNYKNMIISTVKFNNKGKVEFVYFYILFYMFKILFKRTLNFIKNIYFYKCKKETIESSNIMDLITILERYYKI